MGNVFLGTANPSSGDLGPQDVGINTNTGQIFTSAGALPEFRVGGAQPVNLDIACTTGNFAQLKLRNTEGGVNLIQDGNDVYIQQTTGGGAWEKHWAQFTRNGRVALNFDTETKFETHSDGIQVTNSGASPAYVTIANGEGQAYMYADDTNVYIGTRNQSGGTPNSHFVGFRGGSSVMYYNGASRFETAAVGCRVLKQNSSATRLNVTNSEGGAQLWTDDGQMHLGHADANANLLRDVLWSSATGSTFLNHGTNGYASLVTAAAGGTLNGTWTGTITRSAIKAESNGKVLITRDYANTILAEAIELLANGDNAGALTMATDLRN